MATAPSPVGRFIARCRGRLWWQNALPRLHRTLWWATLSAGVSLACVLWARAPGTTPLAVTLLVVAVGAGVMMRCRPSLTETARHVDRAIEGRSLLTTGLELARAANPLTPSQGLVLRRAEDKAGSLRPAATLPIAGGTRLFPPAACVAALLAVSATVEPPGPSPAERVVSLPVPGQISPAPREGSSVEPAGTPGKIDVAEVGASPPQPAAGLGGGVVQTRVPATTTATDEQPESAEPHPGRAFVAASGGQGDEPGVSAGAGGKPRGTQPPPEESAGVGLSVELPVAETLQRAGPMPGAAGTIAGEPGSAVEAVAVPAARPAAPSALAALTPIERRYAARYFERLGEEP